MKKVFASITAVLMNVFVFAQAPQAVTYQAVATNASGLELISSPIGVRASIVQGLINNPAQYIETFAVTTDTFGLFTINIGQGLYFGGTLSNFSQINWGSGPFFLKIEMDATGGNNYSLMGTNQILSVPYSLYSEKSDTANFAYNSDTSNYSVNSNDAWKLLGNAGTDSTNFLGTTDNRPLAFRVNNQNAGKIEPILRNTSIGHLTLNSNTTGIQNSAFGKSALQSNTIGLNNVAIGYQALLANTTGNNNTASGQSALVSNTTGNNNTGIGYWTLFKNTTGVENTATGYQALFSTTVGSYNTAMGHNSLLNNLTGNRNTAFGYQALLSDTLGSNNTALGYNADVIFGNLTNATAIGYNARVGASNSLVLGGTGPDTVNVGINTTTPQAKLDIIGAIKITDGTQGMGKVLTSDSVGMASWQLPQNIVVPPISQPIPISYLGTVIEVSPVKNGIAIGWGAYNSPILGARSWTDGESNTNAIVAQLGNNGGISYAAKVCYDLVAYGHNDWYLPSIRELDAIDNQSYLIPGYGIDSVNTLNVGVLPYPLGYTYWSSTEFVYGNSNGCTPTGDLWVHQISKVYQSGVSGATHFQPYQRCGGTPQPIVRTKIRCVRKP